MPCITYLKRYSPLPRRSSVRPRSNFQGLRTKSTIPPTNERTHPRTRTVQCHHRSLALWRLLCLRDRRLEIGNKRLHDLQRQTLPHPIVNTPRHAERDTTHRTRDMHRSRPTQRIQVPSPLGHPIPDLVHVHRRVLGTERDDRRWRRTENVEFRDGGADGVGNVSGAGDDVAAGLEVAAVGGELGLAQMRGTMDVLGSHVLHRSPCPCNQSAGSMEKDTGVNPGVPIQNASHLDPDKLGLP